MRILHVLPSVNPADGGPVEGVSQLGNVLTGLHHEIEVASLDAPDAPYLSRFPLPCHPLGPSPMKYGFTPRLVPWLREHALQYDAIVVNGIWQYHSFGTWRALRNLPVPYVVYTHGMLDPWFRRKYPLKHAKKWMYWPWAEYRVLRDAAAVIFTCEEERILARESFWLYKANETVVSYGTAGPSHNPQVQIGAFFQRFPELRGKRLALFMGRIHQKKGCDLAIDAFARMLSTDPEWRLVMAGPDQVGWQAALAGLADKLGISDRIVWTGLIDGNIKWGALRSSEFFLLPSHQENFGIVVAEALACGTPVLLSDKVNIWREVRDYGAGLVAGDDLDGTCDVLRAWKGLSEEQKALMRARARRCFEEKFEIRQAAESLLSVLSRVAGSVSAKRQMTAVESR